MRFRNRRTRREEEAADRAWAAKHLRPAWQRTAYADPDSDDSNPLVLTTLTFAPAADYCRARPAPPPAWAAWQRLGYSRMYPAARPR